MRRFLAGLEAAHPQVTTVLEFDPGEAAQVDFGKGPEVIDPRTGELLSTWIFVMTLMTKLAENEVSYGGILEGFRDVLVADATVVKLHRLLAQRFPGTRKNSSPAAAKLHLVMSASGTGAHKVKVTGERANDHRTLQMGPWVEGRLLLFDLGYFRYQLFDVIDRNDGYFITGLAANADPCTVATHRQWRGRSIELVGKRLREVAGRLKRDVHPIDFLEFRVGHVQWFTAGELPAGVVDEDFHLADFRSNVVQCLLDGFGLSGIGGEEADLRPGVGRDRGRDRGAAAFPGT